MEQPSIFANAFFFNKNFNQKRIKNTFAKAIRIKLS